MGIGGFRGSETVKWSVGQSARGFFVQWPFFMRMQNTGEGLAGWITCPCLVVCCTAGEAIVVVLEQAGCKLVKKRRKTASSKLQKLSLSSSKTSKGDTYVVYASVRCIQSKYTIYVVFVMLECTT